MDAVVHQGAPVEFGLQTGMRAASTSATSASSLASMRLYVSLDRPLVDVGFDEPFLTRA
jgi:hypothetical protein